MDKALSLYNPPKRTRLNDDVDKYPFEVLTARAAVVGALITAGYDSSKIYFEHPWIYVEQDLRDKQNWPLLWEAVRSTGYYYGCGSTHHAQLHPDLWRRK